MERERRWHKREVWVARDPCTRGCSVRWMDLHPKSCPGHNQIISDHVEMMSMFWWSFHVSGGFKPCKWLRSSRWMFVTKNHEKCWFFAHPSKDALLQHTSGGMSVFRFLTVFFGNLAGPHLKLGTKRPNHEIIGHLVHMYWQRGPLGTSEYLFFWGSTENIKIPYVLTPWSGRRV